MSPKSAPYSWTSYFDGERYLLELGRILGGPRAADETSSLRRKTDALNTNLSHKSEKSFRLHDVVIMIII